MQELFCLAKQPLILKKKKKKAPGQDEQKVRKRELNYASLVAQLVKNLPTMQETWV